MITRLTASMTLIIGMRLITSAMADTLCMEAESATNVQRPMVAATTATGGVDAVIIDAASAKAFLEIPEGKGNPPKLTRGAATLTFSIEKGGTYTLWARVYWNGECSNSFSMHIDDNPPFSFGQNATYKNWHWVKSPPRLAQLTLKSGTHTLTLANREDGVRIDQVMLTSNRRLVPVGIEALRPGTTP